MAIEKHKKVQVVTLAKENQDIFVLMLQMKEDRDFKWQNVTGSVDAGEDFFDGAKRELVEETGLSAELSELPLTYEFRDRWGKDVLEKVYVATLTQRENNIKLDPTEHGDFKWLNIKDVDPSNFGYPSNFEAFKKAVEEVC